MSKKETEVTVKDTEKGVELFVGKKMIGAIEEDEGSFKAFAGKDLLSTYKTYQDAEEEIIRHYNLSF